ncbi:transposase, partial [uncultured Thomasclavelia sp.]|uniref:transposase n=1 Tax=uncultured Thomasclavelia sp. TaxID=3025759 RepID=UPI00261D8BF6
AKPLILLAFCRYRYHTSLFDRPDFIRMQSLVDSGIVKTIIVKDLSRFGRNYLDVGNYLEIKYPTIGVRFIAIQENVDTLKDGRKGYDNVLLLKAVLFARMVSDCDVRNLESLCKHDIRFMYIMQEATPSHMAFERFMKNYLIDDIDHIWCQS